MMGPDLSCAALELPLLSGYGLMSSHLSALAEFTSLNTGDWTHTQYSRSVLFLFISLQKMAHKSQILDDYKLLQLHISNTSILNSFLTVYTLFTHIGLSSNKSNDRGQRQTGAGWRGLTFDRRKTVALGKGCSQLKGGQKGSPGSHCPTAFGGQ